VGAALLHLALNRLRANLLRSALTVLGIVIGIAAVVSLVSLGSAVQRSIDEQFEGLGVGTLTVQRGNAPSAAPRREGGGALGGIGTGQGLARRLTPAQVTDAPPLTAEDVDAIEGQPGAAAVAPVARSRVEVGAGGTTVSADLVASTAALAATESFTLAAGNFLTDLTVDRRLPVAVVGSRVAEDLGLDPATAIGAQLTIDRRTFVVVGLLEEQGNASFVNADSAVMVPLAAAGSVLGSDPDFDLIRIRATPAAETTLAADLTSPLRASRGLDEDDEADFSIVEATSIIEIADDTSTTMTTLISVIGAISLVVGAIGIANMMLVSVRERTREIGIRRAVGATRTDITWQFLSESIVLSVLGGIIGAVLGVALATGLAPTLLGVTAVVSTTSVLLALVVSFVVGLVAGIGPSWQAASVDPTEALRYE
jgi:putative ABC transport system permease protein